jgi:hypothetical protein
VPISVFDGKTYQDGGIYMASPAPLAVEGDTEYQLLQTGVPQGTFDIGSAGNVDGYWYGYGVWKAIHEATPPKLAPSKVQPTIVADGDPNRPHFKKSDADNSNPSKSQKVPTSAPTSNDDPDKPTLKRRSGDNTDSPAPPTSDDASNSKSQSDDHDRPHLRKRKADPATAQDSVTAINSSDPDRPRLRRGTPEALMQADHLTGTPANLQQMVAVSDGTYREPHPYAFEWANPDDATKMQATLEQIARDALAPKTLVQQKTVPGHRPTTAAGRKQPANTGPPLIDQQFKAFSLDYAGGSTLVFSARTGDDGATIRYVTLIAQPDFYGAPKVIFKQVTDSNHLDITPRLRLIDAVDTDGDNRAELIFEQRSKSDRQFAIYSVRSNRAEQVFATGSIP